MTDALSAERIAELFAAAQEGNLPDRTGQQPERSARDVDFERSTIMGPAEQERFERAHVSFCVEASERLSAELRSQIKLAVIDSAQHTWRAARQDVAQPSLQGVAVCAAGEEVLLCVEQDLIQRLIDAKLGGSYTVSTPPRELTHIDLAIARMIYEELLAELSSVWTELLGYELAFLSFELHGTGLGRIAPTEPTLTLTIEVRDKVGTSTLVLLVPGATIESAPRGLVEDTAKGGESGASRKRTALDVRDLLGRVELKVRAEVGAADLTLEQVLALAPGDMVRLGPFEPAVITASGHLVCRARPGLRGRRRAVKLLGGER